MSSNEKADKTASATDWYLYMLRCGDGSLYTGISSDVERRLEEHRGVAGRNRGAKALRGKQPLQLVFKQAVANKSEALKLEYRVKNLSRAVKEELANGRQELSSLLKCSEKT